MPHNLITLIPYVVILGINFYLLPLLAKNTGAAMLLMLCIMPLVALGSAIMYGTRNGFSLILPTLAFILFFPTIFLYYNPSAWIYAIIYTVIILAGLVIGTFLYKKR